MPAIAMSTSTRKKNPRRIEKTIRISQVPKLKEVKRAPEIARTRILKNMTAHMNHRLNTKDFIFIITPIFCFLGAVHFDIILLLFKHEC